MQIKTSHTGNVTLIEILANNGAPANAQNPIKSSELAEVDFPVANGQIAIISGMPMVAACTVAMRYKNLFSVVAIANPRENVAEVAHSVDSNYRLGQPIPLPALV